MIHKAVIEPVPVVWMTTETLTQYLGVSKDYIDHLRDSGLIQYYKPFGGRKVYYRKDDIDKAILKARQL